MRAERGGPGAMTAGRLAAARGRSAELASGFRRSELAKAAGLAGAMMVSNVLALGTTLAFGRLLDTGGYGALGSLVSAFLILSVGGSALQAAVAREGALGRLGQGGELAETLTRWTLALVGVIAALTLVSVLLRGPIADVVAVEEEWGAAAVLPAAGAWLLLSIQRGLLQALQRYKSVGLSMIFEQFGRLVIGVALVVGGGEVTGAFLGTPLAMVAVAAVIGWRLRAELGEAQTDAPRHRLRDLVRKGWAPIAGLTLVAVLQNVDVIAANHEFQGRTADAYAAAAVAAKVVVWVAVGVGFYVLPEAARRHAAGHDARPVLGRGLGLIAAVAVPSLLVFVLAPELLLRLAFGPKYVSGQEALPALGLAMALLAASYLAVQYLLALHKAWFLVGMAAVAVAEVVLLLVAGDTLGNFAALVLAVQAAAAALLLGLSFRAAHAPHPPLAPAPGALADH